MMSLSPQDASMRSCCKVHANRITTCSRTGKGTGAPLEIQGELSICSARVCPLTCGHADAITFLSCVDSLLTIIERQAEFNLMRRSCAICPSALDSLRMGYRNHQRHPLHA